MFSLIFLMTFAMSYVDVPYQVDQQQVTLQAPEDRQETPKEIRKKVETGCGPELLGDAGLNIVFDISVREACDIHDWQYTIGGSASDRLEADNLMRKNMLRIVNTRRDIWHAARLVWTDTYYVAVRSIGWMFYGKCNHKSCIKVKKEMKAKKKLRSRNQLARSAWETKRNAAGCHGDKKKETKRTACRGKIRY